MTEPGLYIGIMSGTSLDGIDGVIASFNQAPEIVATHTIPLKEQTRTAILELCSPGLDDLRLACRMDVELGHHYATCINELVLKAGIPADQIHAVGCHGQTVRHFPDARTPFTLQLGDPNVIAEKTGIPTVTDFRRRDIAAGGQGAPLVPAFHHYVFGSDTENRVIVNIGGMANITFLAAGEAQISGWDTGPGNVLLDGWIQKQRKTPYDNRGDWGRTGKPIRQLLDRLLDDPYFSRTPPKSTGREYFNAGWLNEKLDQYCRYSALDNTLRPNDTQATLTELTAQTITRDIVQAMPRVDRVLLCGGGALNLYMKECIQRGLPDAIIESTREQGIDPAWIEASAFAWLARQRILGMPGNVPSVTGAAGPRILGGVYLP